MTPDDLDALAVVQSSIRACYEIARARARRWVPAPAPPCPSGAPTASGDGRGGAT